MAALLADARVTIGSDTPAKVVVIQRNSVSSGWKTRMINEGKSPLGGLEAELAPIIERAVKTGQLRASYDFSDIVDADVVLVSVQTDKKGNGPDYEPLLGALDTLAATLKSKPAENIPLVCLESTLAPTTMKTIIRELFAKHGLIDGENILLALSPNRVMPSKLIDRIRTSDKLVSSLNPLARKLVSQLYSNIVLKGRLHQINCLTAEIEKTLENAYRDVRVAYAAEIARYCDAHDIDFFALRDAVNAKLNEADNASFDPTIVPVGSLLIPTIGVGGHCLPKDGVLMLWRRNQNSELQDSSVILLSRNLNDSSPLHTVERVAAMAGNLAGKHVTILGAAYRPDCADTRNSPSLTAAQLLLDRGAKVRIHDPYVLTDDSNLLKLKLDSIYSTDLDASLKDAEIVILGTAHREYLQLLPQLETKAPSMRIFFDASNLTAKNPFSSRIAYAGVGKGKQHPTPEFVDFVAAGLTIVARAFALEVKQTAEFLNKHYTTDPADQADFQQIRSLAADCPTGCNVVEALVPEPLSPYHGFMPSLVERALATYGAPEAALNSARA